MPSIEPTPTNRVAGIHFGHVLPSGARFEDPQDSLECKPLINWWPPALGILGSFGDQRLDLCPLFIRKHLFAHTHRFTSEKCATLNISKVQEVISSAIPRGYASSEVLQPLLVSCPSDSLHNCLPTEVSDTCLCLDHYAAYLRDATLEKTPYFKPDDSSKNSGRQRDACWSPRGNRVTDHLPEELRNGRAAA